MYGRFSGNENRRGFGTRICHKKTDNDRFGHFRLRFEYARFYDVKKLGAIVTKAITLEPREGNSGRRIFETCGGMINRIGLENVGVKRFMAEKLPLLNKGGLVLR